MFSLYGSNVRNVSALTGALDTAGQLIDQLLRRAESKVDEAAVYNLKIRLRYF